MAPTEPAPTATTRAAAAARGGGYGRGGAVRRVGHDDHIPHTLGGRVGAGPEPRQFHLLSGSVIVALNPMHRQIVHPEFDGARVAAARRHFNQPMVWRRRQSINLHGHTGRQPDTQVAYKGHQPPPLLPSVQHHLHHHPPTSSSNPPPPNPPVLPPEPCPGPCGVMTSTAWRLARRLAGGVPSPSTGSAQPAAATLEVCPLHAPPPNLPRAHPCRRPWRSSAFSPPPLVADTSLLVGAGWGGGRVGDHSDGRGDPVPPSPSPPSLLLDSV